MNADWLFLASLIVASLEYIGSTGLDLSRELRDASHYRRIFHGTGRYEGVLSSIDAQGGHNLFFPQLHDIPSGQQQ